jgi:hypothetical protein
VVLWCLANWEMLDGERLAGMIVFKWMRKKILWWLNKKNIKIKTN